jgi:hypothetical protein
MRRTILLFCATLLLTCFAPAAPFSLAQRPDDTVYVTKSGQCYHRDGCRSLRSSRIPMRLEDAAARYRPCSICKPPVLASDTRSDAAPGGRGEAVKEAPKRAAPGGGQCKAITKKGTRCKRKAQPGSEYCWQHRR